MRFVIGSLREASEENLLFAKQLGVDGIVLNTPPLAGQASYGSGDIGATYWVKGQAEAPDKWDFLELLQLRNRVEDFGLKLEAIENTPIWFYDKVMLGLPGREAQLETYCETVQALGQAGIPILGYHWMPTRVWRTSKTAPGRGTKVNAFDLDQVAGGPPLFDRVYGAQEMWDNYQVFIETVLPVAEASGVKLALHPDDPPVPSLGGVGRIFHSIEGFERALELGDSPSHGLDFCMGTWSELGVETMLAALRHFAAKGKVFYIHFRNIQGQVPKFQECFIDQGEVDVVAVLKELKAMNFDGFLIDDHVPKVVNDSTWGHRSRAYATGYIKGLIRAVDALT